MLGLSQNFYPKNPLTTKSMGRFSILVTAIPLLHLGYTQVSSFPSDITIIRRTGASESRPVKPQHIVYIADPTMLAKARTVVPDAFVTNLSTGQQVVQVGRFDNLEFAQNQLFKLRTVGLNAQLQSPNLPPFLPNVPANVNLPVTRPPAPTENLALRNRYFVIIPSVDAALLSQVQVIVPTARLNSSYRGSYIEVQGYPDRPSAETLNATMRSRGLNTRVVFF